MQTQQTMFIPNERRSLNVHQIRQMMYRQHYLCNSTTFPTSHQMQCASWDNWCSIYLYPSLHQVTTVDQLQIIKKGPVVSLSLVVLVVPVIKQLMDHIRNHS